MVYKIQKFCCLSLSTAGLVFGYISLISCIGEFIGLAMVIILLVCSPQDEIDYNIDYDKTNPPKISSPAKITFRLLLCIFSLVCSMSLIIGIKRKSHNMMVPWLASMAACLIILTSLSIISIITGLNYIIINPKEGYIVDLIAGILLALFSGFLFYSWIAVYSLFDNYRKYFQESSTDGDGERLNYIPDLGHDLE
ncbi:uncharacterized protein LOC129921118 isoform X2 [Episyrphus balteatus]|uniref:uncharacterized protein LOC129921118 isoform X2 n=1 Tax=Episyrphus balteatus TaxID=286459 RepID=UPI002485BDFC|nr:uncharacterized protein LOC129921118 isoform X2 [Episyrphus balteatus]